MPVLVGLERRGPERGVRKVFAHGRRGTLLWARFSMFAAGLVLLIGEKTIEGALSISELGEFPCSSFAEAAADAACRRSGHRVAFPFNRILAFRLVSWLMRPFLHHRRAEDAEVGHADLALLELIAGPVTHARFGLRI